jgi:hypothetical protein
LDSDKPGLGGKWSGTVTGIPTLGVRTRHKHRFELADSALQLGVLGERVDCIVPRLFGVQ